MLRKILVHPGSITIAVLFLISLVAYLPNIKKDRKPPSAYDKFISAYTGGEISNNGAVMVRFVDEMVKPASVNVEIGSSDSPIEFTPNIYGDARWIDTRTLEFKSNYGFDRDQVYEASVDLKSLMPTIPDSLADFRFKFKTKKQKLKIELSNPVAMSQNQNNWQKIEGKILAYDFEESYRIKELLSAHQNGESLNIQWRENDTKEFKFSIDSLLRKNDSYSVVFNWDGNYVDESFVGSKQIEIPALNHFIYVGATNQSYPSQVITLEFSDPIQKDQVLDGLVRVGSIDSRISIDNNKILLYPKARITGSVDVVIEAGIENVNGYKTKSKTVTSVSFDEIYPQVKEVGKGTIIPQSTVLPFAFEAVNLSAVDVRVIKITEKNIPQFLQINQLAESRELKRVGSVLLNKKIALDKDKSIDLKRWNKHVLDLSKLIQTEPGAIYQIAIGFRKFYSLCGCTDTLKGDSEDMLSVGEHWGDPEEYYENSYWDYYEKYNEEYSDRENPCKMSYYNSERSIVKNVLASNLGLIAKRGSAGTLFVAATDLLSTAPLTNVKIEVYDYQQQLIGSSITNNGVATLKSTNKPFLIIAKYGKQRGYLRVDNGSSLSLSRFDIAGNEYHKGMKGFIFGERDVWRPGDSLFINFVLEDKLKSLQEKHPVVFELYNPQQELVQRIVKTTSLNHFYTFHTCTTQDAPTGNYNVKVQAGGASFEKSIKIETIIPNRMKINLDWAVDKITASNKNIKGNISAKWLHGAAVQNLKADVTMTLSEAPTLFKTYSEFVFTDEERVFQSERKEIFKGTLNEKGIAEVKAVIGVDGIAPGILKANFKTKVFEPGGNFSSDYFSVPFYPYATYVGIKLPKGDKARNMLLTDVDHFVKLVTIDPDGKLVTGRKITIQLYKVAWKWWWDSAEEEEYSYNGQEYSEMIQTDTIVTSAGESKWKLRVNYPQWGVT